MGASSELPALSPIDASFCPILLAIQAKSALPDYTLFNGFGVRPNQPICF